MIVAEVHLLNMAHRRAEEIMSERKSLHALGAPTSEETERAQVLQRENFPELHLYRTGTLTEQIAAQNRLIVRNYRVITWFVKKHAWCVQAEGEHRLTKDDIRSVAALGFIKTLTVVRYERFSLITYVEKGMHWFLMGWLKTNSWRYEVSFPKSTHDLLRYVRRLEATLHDHDMDTLTPELLVQTSGASIDAARRAIELHKMRVVHYVRTNSQVAEETEHDRFEFVSEHYSREDVEGSDGVPEIEALVGRKQEYDRIMTVLDDMVSSGSVTERSANVLRWRYSLGGEDLTLDEVGERLGVSKNRIRQIEEETFTKLRKRLKHRKIKEV